MPNLKLSQETNLITLALDDRIRAVDMTGPTTGYTEIGYLAAFWQTMPGRLSLSSTLAVPTSDLTAQTTLYYPLTGDKGKYGSLWDGTSWVLKDLSSVSGLSLAALTASSVYDIFVYLNSGTPTLEALIWSSSGAGTSARATDITIQDGRYCKNGDKTRLYLGTILIDAAGGACTDSSILRGVYNFYNQKMRRLMTYNTTASWNYTLSTIREYNAGTGQVRGNFVLGVASPIACYDMGFNTSGTFSAVLSWSVNSTTTINGVSINLSSRTQVDRYLETYARKNVIPLGYNYITQVERVFSGTLTNAGAFTTAVSATIEIEM